VALDRRMRGVTVLVTDSDDGVICLIGQLAEGETAGL
jgi:hypothetical protein